MDHDFVQSTQKGASISLRNACQRCGMTREAHAVVSTPGGELRVPVQTIRPVIYLASPYSDKDKAMQEFRYHKVLEAVAAFCRVGIYVYSPIAHCHEMAKRFVLPTDAQSWRFYNEAFISHFDELWVLVIEGWDKSLGVTMEIAFALNAKKVVRYWAYNGEAMLEVTEVIAR